jgi:hypothetical protein
MALRVLGNETGESPVYTSCGRLAVNAIGDSHYPLYEFFKYVEEATDDIRAFHEGIRLYEVMLLESAKSVESQARYEVLQSTMDSISGDMRRLRNYAWRLGDKFDGRSLLRHANIVLAKFQTACAFLHSVQARSCQTIESTTTASNLHLTALSPIEEVEEPAYDRSRYRQERNTGTYFHIDNRICVSALEVDTCHAKTAEKSTCYERLEHMEASTRGSSLMIEFDFGGVFSKSRIWRQRKLLYISVATAFVVLVAVVGLTTGYAAGIGEP